MTKEKKQLTLYEQRHLYFIFETKLFNSIIYRHQNDDFFSSLQKYSKIELMKMKKKVLN